MTDALPSAPAEGASLEAMNNEMDTNQISPLSKRGREPSEIEAYTLSLAQAILQNTTQTESQAHRLTPRATGACRALSRRGVPSEPQRP